MDNSETIHILILDDDIQLGELLKIYLESSGPFQVEQIIVGSDLFGRLASKNYHLMLLDYHLPDTTGLDVLNDLSVFESHPPVIMMTGKGDQRTAAQAIQRGAADYLIKGDDFLTGLPTLIQNTIRMHQLQEAARQSMEQVRYQALLLDNMRDAVVVWDLQGKITFWNPSAYLLFGLKPKDMIGQSVDTSYLNLFSPPVILPHLGDTATSETEREYRGPNGKVTWISSRLMPLRNPDLSQALIGLYGCLSQYHPPQERAADSPAKPAVHSKNYRHHSKYHLPLWIGKRSQPVCQPDDRLNFWGIRPKKSSPWAPKNSTS